MKVLITPQFNQAMQRLSKEAQQEAVNLYSMVSVMDQAQFANSPLLTKIASTEELLYTLRGRLVRIFCTFDAQTDILFLDVAEVKDLFAEKLIPNKEEVTLYGRDGGPRAYIAADDENTIYSFSGEPLAYLDKQNVYGFNGTHLGWFEEGIIWDHLGQKIGFTGEVCPVFRRFEPFKGFKRFKPFKGFKQFAPFKRLKTAAISDVDLLAFLEEGKK